MAFLRSQRGTHKHFSQVKRRLEATLVILPPGLCSEVIASSGSSFVRPLISTFVGSSSHSSSVSQQHLHNQCSHRCRPLLLNPAQHCAQAATTALCPGCHHSWLPSKCSIGKRAETTKQKRRKLETQMALHEPVCLACFRPGQETRPHAGGL